MKTAVLVIILSSLVTIAHDPLIITHEGSEDDNYRLVEISAYTSSVDETDDTPFITASGKRTRRGIIANNCLEFGTKVETINGKTFEVQDRMNSRYGCENFDIWMESKEEAWNWGRRQIAIKL